jgi:hypothetical protein
MGVALERMRRRRASAPSARRGAVGVEMKATAGSGERAGAHAGSGSGAGAGAGAGGTSFVGEWLKVLRGGGGQPAAQPAGAAAEPPPDEPRTMAEMKAQATLQEDAARLPAPCSRGKRNGPVNGEPSTRERASSGDGCFAGFGSPPAGSGDGGISPRRESVQLSAQDFAALEGAAGSKARPRQSPAMPRLTPPPAAAVRTPLAPPAGVCASPCTAGPGRDCPLGGCEGAGNAAGVAVGVGGLASPGVGAAVGVGAAAARGTPGNMPTSRNDALGALWNESSVARTP